MARKRYRTISIPEELTEVINDVLESEKYGYTSASEFIKECIRDRLRELGYKI